jgi:hypothetical protein
VDSSIPASAETQLIANANAYDRPSAATRFGTPVSMRKPRIAPNASSTVMATAKRTTSARTAPTSGAERAIGRLRNR